MPDSHALLAPSAAKRWMACPPSAQLEARVPERDTDYTREGTLAHKLAETLLTRYVRSERSALIEDIEASMREVIQTVGLDAEMSAIWAEAEANDWDFWGMLRTVHDDYVAIVFQDWLATRAKDKGTRLDVEVRLDLTQFIPEGFGSADAVISGAGVLKVYDLKYGKGVKVDAVENPQIMIYGLGALLAYDFLATDVIEMHIVQPRLRHASVYSVTCEALLQWGFHELAPAAAKAWTGEGELSSGEHCRFCKVAARCPGLRERARVAVTSAADPRLLTGEDLAASYGELETVKAWCKAVEEEALRVCASPSGLPGYKLVAGRSVRSISDPERAIAALHAAGFVDDAILRPRELKTVTDLEKLLRKAAFQEILGPYVVKPQGKPAIAREDDPRPAWSPADGAAADFSDINA